jgi:hypothetical protein
MTSELGCFDSHGHEDRSWETSTRAYWLAHCEGFRVDGCGGGRIGFVEDVRDQGGQPLLAVRAGLLGWRVLLIPAREVFEIVPRSMRIWLRSQTAAYGAAPSPELARSATKRRRKPLSRPRAA